ncbi:serine/threonine-protein kinase [Actinoplanes sp. NPDC051494]|uniref:serine/threonine-protein kinase n=1 Tax=Actinoplanes sp. NPDC051494 TaxID=3363907 RepID=UPI0037A70552
MDIPAYGHCPRARIGTTIVGIPDRSGRIRPHVPTSTPSPGDDGAATADLSGRRVGSEYVLICPVGQGATGTVWRGLESSTGDQVAVKLLHEGLVRQPKLVTRFVQERSILKLVRHEHVVGVRGLFSVGESLGLAMDFVAGGSLRERLRRDGPVAPGEAARLLAQVAAALAVAHGLGVVHRDVKPDNILLQADGEHPDVRLTDFGIARVLDSPGLTSSHAVIGTPHYMAPEAISGGEAAPAADVYALGIVLFELVAGRTPYAGESFAVLRAHLDDRPRRPVGMPGPVWALIVRCLDKDPARRPEAAALQDSLRTLSREMAGVPALPGVPAPPVGDRGDARPGAAADVPRPRPRRRPQNRPHEWAWGRRGLLGLIILGVLAGGCHSWRDSPAAHPGEPVPARPGSPAGPVTPVTSVARPSSRAASAASPVTGSPGSTDKNG